MPKTFIIFQTSWGILFTEFTLEVIFIILVSSIIHTLSEDFIVINTGNDDSYESIDLIII